ncbi:MAG: nuclear transport factor 2 family protein [Gammaproteobacteria bacterium]|nr:nuclear transport factor 2 family protein [Gammaproteobacteria bacterium]
MTSTQSGKGAAVAAAVDALGKAMLAADTAALDKLTMNELTYGHATSRLETKAQLMEALATGKAGYTSIDVTNQTITVLGGTAIVRHHFRGVRRTDGEVMKTGILMVWLEQPDKQWKLAARQAVKLA